MTQMRWMRRHSSQRGRQLAMVNALIATVALRYDLTLLTTDNDFAPVSGLRVATWLP